MNSTTLLKKLLVIERSIGTASQATLRALVYDAQECVLQMQKERAEAFFIRSVARRVVAAEAGAQGVVSLEQFP